MTDFIPREKGVPIRFPSEANLLVDSSDRGTLQAPSGSPGNFQISRAGNLLNGFFTRITPVEIALDWRIPNVGPYGSTSDGSNNIVRIDISGASTIDPYQFILPTGCYSGADVVDYIVAQMNVNPGGNWVVQNIANAVCRIKDLSGALWRFAGGPSLNNLVGSLGYNTNNGVPSNPFAQFQDNTYNPGAGGPLATNGASGYGLSKYKYLDFVSPQLTNQQDVKDGTTSKFFQQNSLFRWYLGYTNDNPNPVDKYGFPSYPTDKQFFVRRELASPKFIKWEANIPIGNLDFQVYATRWFPQDVNNPATWTTLLDKYPNGAQYPWSWMMTLQASEV